MFIQWKCIFLFSELNYSILYLFGLFSADCWYKWQLHKINYSLIKYNIYKSWSAAYFKEVWYCTDRWVHLGYVGEDVVPDPAGVSGVMCQGRSGQGRAGPAASAVPVRDTEDCGSVPAPVTSLLEHRETSMNVELCNIWSLWVHCLCIS